jgi:FlaA1/EpsC-like NDP-sugar epimerase
VPLFTKQIAEGGPVTITHQDIIRYFMTIPEACQLVLEAGAMGNGGEIFIFDMGKPVKIIDLARKMIKLAGFIPDKDIKIEVVGLRPGEKLYEELLNDSAKTLPTHHEKIMIAEEVHEEIDFLFDEVADLNDTSKTLPTHHHKIMIAQETHDDYDTLFTDIEELISLSHFVSNEEIVSQMKKIVPEFVSMNSAFEVLDK